MGLKNRITGHFTKEEPQSLSSAVGSEVISLLPSSGNSSALDGEGAQRAGEGVVAEDSSKADGND